jgi:hypothetical protein
MLSFYRATSPIWVTTPVRQGLTVRRMKNTISFEAGGWKKWVRLAAEAIIAAAIIAAPLWDGVTTIPPR